MNKPKHTPGPWMPAANFHQTGRIVSEYGQIAYIPNFKSFVDARPNADLIAASPNILQAAEQLIYRIREGLGGEEFDTSAIEFELQDLEKAVVEAKGGDQ